MHKICITGHRPDKLFGYDFQHPGYARLKEKLREMVMEEIRKDPEHKIEMISGMALGTDMIFAELALALRDSGYGVSLTSVVAVRGVEKKWIRSNPAAVELFRTITERADRTVYLSPEGSYNSRTMQNRNIYMADLLCDPDDRLIAVWDGSPSGTKNCVRYAGSRGVEILYIHPRDI